MFRPGRSTRKFRIPFTANSAASVLVQNNGANSTNSSLTIATVSPAIFSQAGTGVGLAAILNGNNSLNTSAAPAMPGQTIQIFATGLGATTPAVVTGAGGAGQPLAGNVNVTIGGLNATVTFAGAAPGFAGLDQINVVVPNVPSVPSGDQPIVISIDNAQSAANVTVAVSSTVTTTAGSIQSTYFGMHLSPMFFNGALPWPTIPFGALRLMGDNVTWADLEPTQGNFTFTNLDKYIAAGKAHGQTDFLITLVKTPTWASSNPTATGCSDYANRLGGCFPPSDLNADGTGADQLWKTYVTTLVQHVCASGTCSIHNFEIWNEPNAPNFWRGTTPQLVRMTMDAYNIIKSINSSLTVVGPAPAGGGDPSSTASSFLQGFVQDGGGQYVDVIAFHGYLLPAQAMADQEELITTGIGEIAQAASSVASKPLWDTEGSWALSTNLEDPDLEVSFVARFYLLQDTTVQRAYWYSYADPSGTLYNESTMTLLEPGIAYGQVYNWMVGAVPSACATSGSIYTCGLTRSGGYQGLAVWDSSLSCSNGSCATTSYTVPSGYTQYRDLAGNVTSINSNSQIQIGIKPILLENQNP
jgi:uncharacterized protein (TIGR03437 family)